MNQFTVAGTLGKEPELRNLQDGKSVCTVLVATEERWKDRETGEQKKATEWHRITIWGARGEGLAGILRKGDKVCISGSLKTKSYDKNGVTVYDKQMIARDVTLLGGNKPQGRDDGPPHEDPQPRHRQVDSFPPTNAADDDIPF